MKIVFTIDESKVTTDKAAELLVAFELALIKVIGSHDGVTLSIDVNG